MAIFTEQTIAGNFDPGATPVPFAATIITMQVNDADDDGFIRSDGNDQINGSDVVNVWVGDTITLNGDAITGVTFYTADSTMHLDVMVTSATTAQALAGSIGVTSAPGYAASLAELHKRNKY